MKFKNQQIVNKIIGRLNKLNIFDIAWECDFLVASLACEHLSPLEPRITKIALHFNFDLEDKEYSEQMQIVDIESCIKGVGSELVSLVMDCVPKNIKVCVIDGTDGEAKKFWPKMAEKYPNIVIY